MGRGGRAWSQADRSVLFSGVWELGRVGPGSMVTTGLSKLKSPPEKGPVSPGAQGLLL